MKYDEQSGKCIICKTSLGKRDASGNVPSTAQLDHDHLTGQLRGVLSELQYGSWTFR